MATSLADLRARKIKRPIDTVEICTDPEATAEASRLAAEIDQLRFETARRIDGGAPRKVGQAANDPRLVKLRAELEQAYDLMRESTGRLTLQAIPAGEWARWKDEHPPRKDNPTDERLVYGLFDSSALLGDLDKWAIAWEGEPLAPGDWDMFAQLSGDLAVCIQTVFNLQESLVSVAPKSSAGSSQTETSGAS